MKRVKNYIAGELHDPISGNWLDNIEPATGKVYAQTPDSNPDDLAQAIDAARDALPNWSAMSAAERSSHLLRLGDVIENNLEAFARAESIDNGKPITLARTVDIPRSVANLRFFATAILHQQSELHDMTGKHLNYTLRQPRGIGGCISPWNLPLYLFTWKVAPALATGNTIIGKPSEVTPMTAHMLGEAAIESGFPPGVLNIVHGRGPTAGQSLVEHPAIKTISFTGGTATGAAIAKICGPMFKKYSLELGGKNASVVFDDCDYDQTLTTSIRAAFANQGQICLCGSRILIHESIYEKFKHDFIERAAALKCGDPLDEQTQQGAVVSREHQAKVIAAIDTAVDEGGTVLYGGGAPEPKTLPERCRKGFFVQPTVINGLDNDCKTNQQEIFGPVVTLQSFATEEDAISMTNATNYGLAASIWTKNATRAHRVAANVDAGVIWVNCWLVRDLRTPFGGMKQSGIGREGGNEALRFWTEPKNVCIATC